MKIFKKLIMILTLAFMMLGSITTAYAAETDQGSGNGDTTVGGQGMWQLYTASGSQTAWQRWMAVVLVPVSGTKWSESSVVNYIKSSDYEGATEGTKLVNACRNSDYIWVFSMGASGTQPQQWSAQSTSSHLDPHSSAMKSHSSYDIFKDNAKSAQFKTGRVSLVCSWNITYTISSRETNPVYEYQWVDNGDSSIATGVYANETRVDAVNITGLDYFRNNSESNTSGVKRTTFGDWYENNKSRIESLSTKEGADYTNLLNALRAEANTILSSNYRGAQSVTLSTRNKDALKFGGIFQVTEREKSLTISSPVSKQQVRSRTETRVQNCTYKNDVLQSCGSWTVESYGTWSAWSDTGQQKGRSTVNAAHGTMVAVSYYQILGVRCNSAEFNAVINQISGETVSSAPNAAYSIVTTQKQTNAGTLPFGNASHANTTLRRTAQASFYTQIAGCNLFQCTVQKITSGSPSNDAHNNDLSTNDVAQNINGATVNSRANIFQFFRDNEVRTIRVNTWYPKMTSSSPDISINSNAGANRTYLARSSEGTPTGDIFKMTSTTGTSLATGSSLASSSFAGHINRFNVSASWASDENKPQKFSVGWRYSASITSRIPSTVTSSGVTSMEDSTAGIDVFCEMRSSNSGNYQATITMDGSVPSSMTELRNDLGKYFGILFVRAVGE